MLRPEERRREITAYVLILLLAAVLRVYGLTNTPLWLDEGYSWWDARQSITSLWNLVPLCDPHPPLYAILLKGWISVFGDGIAALRLMSGLAGVIATGFVILAGRELSMRHAVIGGLVFATTAFQVQFAQEARPYAMVSLAAAMMLFGALRVVRSQTQRLYNSRPGWFALVIGTALMFWLNNTAALTAASLGIAAAALMVFDRRARALARPMIIAVVAIVLLWLPYVPTFIEQARGVSASFWIGRPGWWQFKAELAAVVGMGPYWSTQGMIALWAIIALWAAGIVLLARSGKWREALMLGCLGALPAILSFFVSRVATPVFLARALIGIGPAFALGVACSFAALHRRAIAAIPAVALVVIHIAFVLPGLEATDRKEPWNKIAATIVDEARQANMPLEKTSVLVVPNEMVLPLGHAFKTMGLSVDMHGAPRDYPAPFLDKAHYPSGKCAPAVEDIDLAPAVKAVDGYRTVFFITRRGNTYDRLDSVPAFLEANGMKLQESHTFEPGALVVVRYARD